MSRLVATLRAGAVPLLAASALVLFACSKPEAPPPLAETPAPTAPTATSPSGAQTVPSPSASLGARGSAGVATEEDFEEESVSKITRETLDAQLDALEREIEAE